MSALLCGQACGSEDYRSAARFRGDGLGLLLAATPADAEFQIGVYGGWSESFDSDIHLTQPGGTNLTLSDVPVGERLVARAALLGTARHLLA